MSNVHPKTQELKQAQIAAFSAERIEFYKDKRHLLNTIGTLALGNVHDVSRALEEHEYRDEFKTEDNRFGRVEAGVELPVAAGKDFVSYLREVGGSNYEPIKIRQEILEAYKDFKDIVDTLRVQLADPSKRDEHVDIMGSGSNAQVFKIKVGSKDFAVRVPRGGAINASQVDNHLAGAIAVRDIPHYEHIVAASYEDGVTVAEVMPGKEVGKLDPDVIAHVSDTQLEDLLSTLEKGHEKGAHVDPKPSNFFYDIEHGFGIVDLNSSNVLDHTIGKQSLGDKIGEAGMMLDSMGRFDRPTDSLVLETGEYYKKELELSKLHATLLGKYRDLVIAKAEFTDKDKALEMIGDRLEKARQRVTEYSDPNWVTRKIENTKKARLKREEENKRRKEGKLSGWDTVDIVNDFV